MRAERGDFDLFVVVLFRQPVKKWDLLISATWLNPDDIGSLRYVLSELRSVSTDREMTEYGRVLILPTGGATIVVASDFDGKTGRFKPHNVVIGNKRVKVAYVMAAVVENKPSVQSQRKRRAVNPQAPQGE